MKRFIILTAFTWFSFSSFGQSENLSRQVLNEKVNELKAIQDESQLNHKLNELKNGQSEDDLRVLYSYYSSQKGGAEKANEIKTIGESKFPKGSFAYAKASANINEETDLSKKEKLYTELVKNFPDKDPSSLTFSLAREFAAAGNTQKMLEYYSKMKGSEGAYINLLYILSMENPKDAEPLLKPVVDSLKLVTTNASQSTDRKAQAARNTYFTLAASYGRSLIANGKIDAGYTVAKELWTITGEKNLAVSSLYLTTLFETKRWHEALPLAEKAITENLASPDVKTKLKEAYIGVKGSTKGFTEYEKQLLQAADDFIVEEAKKKAINEPSVNFSLKDVNGKTVSLSELKGKVVVLDFWATWCGPCKASFPAMQKALNKYKNDPNVVFYFVHTMDKTNGDPTLEAKDYVTKNNYSFDVLMDIRSQETGRSQVAAGYKIEGIPTKLVIDPNGNIRFNVVGFGGGDEMAVKELSAMIEYAKTTK